MSEFPFYKKSHDHWGHVVYYCNCSECGIEVAYGRKIDIAPLCESCKRRAFNQKAMRKRNAKAKNQAIDDCISAAKKYDCPSAYISCLELMKESI